ncbi:MAG: Ig domain-containing protein [Burkholderiales bacterium]|nr:Ig domain-containing protein [Burkholderiales bacterium]
MKAMMKIGLLGGLLGLAGCGGGGGTVDTRPTYSIQLTADRTTLPVNVARIQPNIGGTYTATLYVKAQDNAGNPVPNGENVFSCNIVSGLENGSLYYLDGKAEHEKEEVLGDGTTVKVPIAYRSVTLGASAGVGSFHYHTTDKAGTATIRCAYTDPNGQIRHTAINLTVGGAPSNLPSQVAFHTYVPGYLFVQGFNQPTQANLRLSVVDEAGRPVPQPASGVNNVRVRIVPTSSADETAAISGVNAAGQTIRGKLITLRTDADGLVGFKLDSGQLAGDLVLEAVADRADNDVDNGLQNPVRGYLSVPVLSQLPTTGLAIATDTLPSAQKAIPYAVGLQASGGSPPYNWSIDQHRLPTGLVLTPEGIIHGITYDAVGTYNFVVELRDRLNTRVQKSLNLVLGTSDPVTEVITIGALNPAQATRGTPYTATLVATGGYPPYQWRIVQPSTLPEGLQLTPLGVLSGTPTGAAGPYVFTVEVVDTRGIVGRRAFTLNLQ